MIICQFISIQFILLLITVSLCIIQKYRCATWFILCVIITFFSIRSSSNTATFFTPATATPSIPCSTSVATLTCNNGCLIMFPSTILSTVPLFFSRTKISFGPRNAILVGTSSPLKTTSALRLGSISVGPPAIGAALVYAA